MASLSTPQINRNARAIVDLDYGQQIIVDKDTHFSRVQSRLNDPDPATAIQIEPSGVCWSFTLEGGVWWHNEYLGDVQGNPQLQKKIRATEEERIGRERARKQWEERARGSIPDDGFSSGFQDQPYYYGQTSRTNGFQTSGTFSDPAINFVNIQQNAQTNSFLPPPYYSVNTVTHAPNFGPPPMLQGGWAPQPPSFPPGFPFHSDVHSSSGTPSRGSPSPPSSPPLDTSYHTAWPSRHWTPRGTGRVNRVNYVQMGGGVKNIYVDQSASVSGNNNNVTWIR
jgi:hypothetical protein